MIMEFLSRLLKSENHLYAQLLLPHISSTKSFKFKRKIISSESDPKAIFLYGQQRSYSFTKVYIIFLIRTSK